MERTDNINMGIPAAASMLGLDMQLSSHGHHLQFHSPDVPQHGPIRHHVSPSPSGYSPYGQPAVARGGRPVMPPVAPGGPDHQEDSDGKRPASQSQSQQQQACPWGRMKWTEGMVRLLIAEVYRVGDDGGGGGNDGGDHHGKGGANRASGGGGGAAKGKWKGVSRAMMEKGFNVSPQQCEDKFNDLNKRYKRVIDLLGKGTACRVVENPTLLDSMDHLSNKAKEEARKLLSSKHLFFPEMCAYHNAGAHHPHNSSPHHQVNVNVNNVPSDQQQQCAVHHASDQQINHHPKQNGHGHAAAVGSSDDEDDNNIISDDDGGESEDDSSNKEDHGGYDSDYYHAGGGGVKKHRNSKNSPPLSLSLSSTSGGGTAVQQLKSELAGVVANGGGDAGIKQWIKRRSVELEEQRVSYQCRAYQLERQRFKWVRYSANKEREMEKMRLHNDRLRLENERMLLLIRQKEIEMCNYENAPAGAAAVSSTEQLQLQQQQQYIQK